MSMNPKVTPALLAQVARDNIRTHQIGEIRDGIDWETAHDAGFVTPEEAAGLPITPEASGLLPDVVPLATGQAAVGGANPEMSAETKAEISTDKPFVRIDDTVERRKKFSAPGAHLEQEALTAKIARETREKFHLPE